SGANRGLRGGRPCLPREAKARVHRPVTNQRTEGGGMLVGVVGAGAMGTGIAQVAATAGDRVIIADATPNATEKARASIAKTLDREVEKQRLSRDDADAVLSRIEFQEQALHGDAGAYRDCDLVVEAIVERATSSNRSSRRSMRLSRLT